MPFSFLNPWLWMGAFAVAAPLWLHLRRKRQTDLLRFSAVRFLQDQPTPRLAPLRLRDLVLFVLRVLAILLIVSAFAWPFIRGMNTLPIRESRVYILDNTLSHQANDGFKRDRDMVARELARAENDLQVAVVELTSVPKVIVSFGDNRQAAIQRMEELAPSNQRGSYLAAFRQANSMLENSFGETKRIIFLSDGQVNQWTENANTPPFLKGVQVDVSRPPASSLPNLSVSDPRVQRVFLGDKSLVNLTARLTHQGPATSAKLILTANGQAIFNRSVDLENQPETILVHAQWESDPASWLLGEINVQGSPDALGADNRAFFSLPPVFEGKVALLAQSPYVRLALSPEIMRGHWEVHPLALGSSSSRPDSGKENDKASPAVLEQSDDNLLDDVLCIESSYLQSAEARRIMTGYLGRGKGVLLLLNRTTPVVDGFLRDLGFEPQGAVRSPPDAPEKFQFVLSNHPIFHPFLSSDYGNLTEIRVFDYVKVKTADAMPLIFGEKGDGLFFQAANSKGRLFVCAFGLDRDHSSWPIHQSFIPFLDLVLQAARGADPMPSVFEPAEIASLQFPVKGGPREVSLRSQDREVAQGLVEQGKVRLRVPDQPGHYSITYDGDTRVQKVFSVNPSPKESELRFAESPDPLRMWSVNRPVQASPAKAHQAVRGFRLAGVLQQHWWWWMVLSSLLLLFIEMTWAGCKNEGEPVRDK